MHTINTAMILAAGRGTRMRAAPDAPPKPLTPIEIGGQSSVLIDFILDEIIKAGIERIIINIHHKAEQIVAHIEQRRLASLAPLPTSVEILFSDERDLLRETGGGVLKAQSLLGAQPFLVCNGDIMWQAKKPILADFMAAFRPDEMAAFLLLADKQTAIGASGDRGDRGDFIREDTGHLVRVPAAQNTLIKEYIFTGAQILSPSLFTDIKEEVFSLNRIYDKAAQQARLGGHILDGRFLHIGTAEALAELHKQA